MQKSSSLFKLGMFRQYSCAKLVIKCVCMVDKTKYKVDKT